jgi:hypothetical protein
MTRLILGVVFVVGVGAGVAATTITRPDFLSAIDHPTIASPCAPVQTMQATPFVFDGAVWTTYLCADNRVVMRQFGVRIEVHDFPPAPPVVCPGIFVHTADKQGCVPPDHPLAPKAKR